MYEFIHVYYSMSAHITMYRSVFVYTCVYKYIHNTESPQKAHTKRFTMPGILLA